MEKTETLADGLLRELKRNRELLLMYESIPTGVFGATLLRQLIERTERAMTEGDIVQMNRNITFNTRHDYDIDGLL